MKFIKMGLKIANNKSYLMQMIDLFYIAALSHLYEIQNQD